VSLINSAGANVHAINALYYFGTTKRIHSFCFVMCGRAIVKNDRDAVFVSRGRGPARATTVTTAVKVPSGASQARGNVK